MGTDVVVDSTGFPDFGAQFAYNSIQNGKHVVMVNLEADAVVGSTLGIMAERAGVVYTVADGDQPSHIKGLVDWAQALEFDVIAAGKGSHLYPNFKGKMWNNMADSFETDTYSKLKNCINFLKSITYGTCRSG